MSRDRIVLCVDDEPAILRSLRRAFHREPYELVAAGSAEEALRVLEDRPVDLVIADHRMPGMSGAELLRQVAARWPHIARIMLSGYAEDEALDADGGASYHHFMAKPWRNDELRDLVRTSLPPALAD